MWLPNNLEGKFYCWAKRLFAANIDRDLLLHESKVFSTVANLLFPLAELRGTIMKHWQIEFASFLRVWQLHVSLLCFPSLCVFHLLLPSEAAASISWMFLVVELAREERESGGMFRTGAITPDGLIDEDFEEELGSPSEENPYSDPESEFRDIAKYGIVQVAGKGLQRGFFLRQIRKFHLHRWKVLLFFGQKMYRVLVRVKYCWYVNVVFCF